MSALFATRCRQVRAQLGLLAGNDLPVASARAAWAHLAECAGCREDFGALRAARAALADVERARPAGWPGEEFFAELQRDVLAAAAAPVATPRRRAPAWAAGVAAAVLIATGAVLLQPRGDGLLEREPIAGTPQRAESRGQIREVGWPIQGLGAQERARHDLERLLDERPRDTADDDTRELVDTGRRRRSERR
jgi:hypothetical protein